jgi:uncharacterized protein (TIGR02246 family)
MDDAQALREVVARVEAGWNAGDGDAFAAEFAADADYVVIDGQYIRGRATIAAGHHALFGGVYRGSRTEGTVEAIRLLCPDVALVHVRWRLRLTPPGGEQQQVESRSTLVCLRTTVTGWEIAAFQNTPLDTGRTHVRAEDAMRKS